MERSGRLALSCSSHICMRSLRSPRRLTMVMNTETQGLAAEAVSDGVPWWVRYSRWRPTSLKEAKVAEGRLLSLCSTELELRDVSVGEGKENSMHTVVGGPVDGMPLVCLPGYGAGSGFYFRNIDALSKQFRLHLVDLLGTGMSGRPKFSAKSREEAEDFFLDALSEWRQEMGVEKMVLVGHSLGGYLAASYALRYPQHVEHLILVCPAGMSQPPDPTKVPEWASSPWTLRGQFYRLGKTAWERGVTPGSIIRTLGPFGPKLIHGYSRNRFKEGMGLSSEEVAAFQDYFYHITAAKGSGEFALAYLLGPFAWARHPLEGRLQELKVPCSFIYGEHDWMKPENGQRVLASVERQRGKLSPGDLQIDVIPDAGHYPFLDQPQMFHQRLVKQTQHYMRWQDPASAAKMTQLLQPRVGDDDDLRQQWRDSLEGRQFDI